MNKLSAFDFVMGRQLKERRQWLGTAMSPDVGVSQGRLKGRKGWGEWKLPRNCLQLLLPLGSSQNYFVKEGGKIPSLK